MSIRAKTAISENQITGLHLVGDRCRAGHVVGSQPGHSHPQQHARADMKQGQQLGHRKTAPLALARGLAEVCLKLRSIGHGAARSVDGPDAKAQPARGIRSAAQDPGGLLDELVEEGQGEPLAGRTVGGVGEPPLSELDDVLAGGVLQEHLKKEQVDGLDGAEHPFPPVIPDILASRQNRPCGDRGGNVLAQA